MANEIYENKHSEKKLDRYGVWVKKTPATKKTESDNFVSEINDYEEDFEDFLEEDFLIDEEVPVVSFDEDLMEIEVPEEPIDLDETEEEKETVAEVLDTKSYDEAVGFAPIGEVSLEEVETDVYNEESDMSLDPANIEDVNLDDFLSDSTTVEEHKPAKEVTEEKASASDFETIDLDDFGIESSEPATTTTDSTDNEHIDLDIHFEDIAQEITSNDKAASSAFDDLLDELTGSDDDMVEVSLDDFMDDIEPPHQEVEEVQEIPEPKTTVEEFSLASIKSKSSNFGSDAPSSKDQKTEISEDSFEEISLDDFFADETIVDATTGAETTMTETSSKPASDESGKFIDLTINEDFDEDPLPEITGGISYNEVENLDLLGNEIKTDNQAKQKKEINNSDTEETTSDKKTNLTDKKIGESNPEETSEKIKPISDLAAIAKDEEASSFVPESPDFELEDGAQNFDLSHEQEDENIDDDIFDPEPIAENHAFDDVSALTNDLLSGVKPATETKSDSVKAESNEETNKLLMQLVEQISSMKSEIASLKDELVSVKEAKLVEPKNAVKSDDFTDEDIVESLELEVEKTSSGFFNDDGSDETISLTGDELDNLINTAEFDNEKDVAKDDELEVPEVLDMSKTFTDYSDSETSDDEEFVVSDGTEIDIPEMSFDDEPEDTELATEETSETEASTDADIDLDIPEMTFDDEPDETELATEKSSETEASTDTDIDLDIPEISFDDEAEDAELATEKSSETEASTDADIDLDIPEISFDDEPEDAELATEEASETEASTDTDIDLDIPEISFDDKAEDAELVTEEASETEASTDTDIDLDIPEISFDDEAEDTELATEEASETEASTDADIDLDIPEISFDDEAEDAELATDETSEPEASTDADIDLDIPEISFDDESDSSLSAIIDDDDEPVDLVLDEAELSAAENLVADNSEDASEIETEEVDNAAILTDDKTSEAETEVEELTEIDDEEILPSELLAEDEEEIEFAPTVVDEAENFNADDLDKIVEDIPKVDLDVQSLDKQTATDLQEQISTVKQEINQQKEKETLPIDMKEEIKSVLTYMDQLLESLPEEKIEEFAKSEYFETYKKLFEDLGIS
ncbi:MAG: hypothetical protein P1P64_01185 [Treponemataceae bacterium]